MRHTPFFRETCYPIPCRKIMTSLGSFPAPPKVLHSEKAQPSLHFLLFSTECTQPSLQQEGSHLIINGERYHIRIAHRWSERDASLSEYPNTTAQIITHHRDHTQPPFPSSRLVLSGSTQHQFYCVTFPGETSVHMYSCHVGQ